MIRPGPTGGQMCTPRRRHFVPHNGLRCLSITRMGATSVGPLTPILVWGSRMDCNESPTPQRDAKVMGKVPLTTEVLVRRNLEHPHTSAQDRNRTRNRSAVSSTPCRLDYGYRTDNKKPLVTYRFLNLSSFLDLSPGVLFQAVSIRC